MDVSFIIPACNEAEYIGDAVDAIQTAVDAYEGELSHEIIVVDDGSEDATAATAAERGARVVSVHERNIAAARNAGAAEADGKFLIFIDADTRPSAQLVQETFAQGEPSLTWGTAEARLWDEHSWWVGLGLRLFNWYYVRRRHFAYGFYFVVTREAFVQTGGFSTTTDEGEDMALSKLLLAEYGKPHVFKSPVDTSARKTKDFGFAYHLKMIWLGLRHGDAMYTHPSIADYRDGDQRLSAERQRKDAGMQ